MPFDNAPLDNALLTPPAAVSPARKPIDWDLVALLLARGTPVTKVAEAIGCSRVTIWRHLRTCARTRKLLAEEHAAQHLEAAAAVLRLRSTVIRQMERLLEDGNVRMVTWLADRLGLVVPDLPAALAAASAEVSVFEDESDPHEVATPAEVVATAVKAGSVAEPSNNINAMSANDVASALPGSGEAVAVPPPVPPSALPVAPAEPGPVGDSAKVRAAEALWPALRTLADQLALTSAAMGVPATHGRIPGPVLAGIGAPGGTRARKMLQCSTIRPRGGEELGGPDRDGGLPSGIINRFLAG